MQWKKITVPAMAFLALLILSAVYVENSEARRFGGGRSFGSRPSYQKQMTRPGQTNRQSQTRNPGTAPMRRPGGMFGGLFGGLLVGGLLGSLFFGGHFMGPNLLDLLIIGGLLYLAFRFFRSRRPQEQRNTPGASAAETHTRGHHGWDTLRSSAGATSAASEGDGKSRPDGFDEQEFLAGAKAAFVRLQQSWDERDLDDIAQFTAPEVLQTIREQAELDSQPGKTDILVLDAELLDVRQLGSQTVADVEFTARMQEDGEVKNVREVWHFSRYDHDPQSGWILEGLQQVH